MTAPDRTRLLGRYRTPRFRYGDGVVGAVRGEVVIVGLSPAPIPWPVGKRRNSKFLVLYGDPERAVRRESAAAVCPWWGVTAQTVSKWPRALGVGQYTPGTTRLKSASAAAASEGIAAARELARAKAGDPDWRRKISAARKGKRRPSAVIERLSAVKTGTRASPETRAKMSAAHKARGTRPPACKGPPWTPEEDEILRSLPPRQAALRLRRPLASVYGRRHKLKLPDAGGRFPGA